MATFHGFSIEGMESWDGRDGVGYGGELYLNGNLLGEFINEGNGGCVFYRFPTDSLKAAIREQLPELEAELGYNGGLDGLVAYLADMTEEEEILRRMYLRVSKPDHAVAVATNGISMKSFLVPRELDDGTAEDQIRSYLGESYSVKVWREYPTVAKESDNILDCPAAINEARELQRRINEANGKPSQSKSYKR